MGINRSKFKNQIRASRNRKSMISSNATTWIQQRFLFYFAFFISDDDSPERRFHLPAPTTYSRMRNYTQFFFPTPVSFYLLFVCLFALLPLSPLWSAVFQASRYLLWKLGLLFSTSVWWKFCPWSAPKIPGIFISSMRRFEDHPLSESFPFDFGTVTSDGH